MAPSVKPALAVQNNRRYPRFPRGVHPPRTMKHDSDYTGKISGKTKNIFVECTGWDKETVKTGLNVIVAALADRGGKVEQLQVVDRKEKYWAPDFTPRKASISMDYVRKISGMAWKDAEIVRLLKRAVLDHFPVKPEGLVFSHIPAL